MPLHRHHAFNERVRVVAFKGEIFVVEIKNVGHICAITAGTPGVRNWTPERRKAAGRQFVDVGIAEEHAVALASGIAKAGGKPVFGVCSSFIQRAYDQLSQDLPHQQPLRSHYPGE